MTSYIPRRATQQAVGTHDTTCTDTDRMQEVAVITVHDDMMVHLARTQEHQVSSLESQTSALCTSRASQHCAHRVFRTLTFVCVVHRTFELAVITTADNVVEDYADDSTTSYIKVRGTNLAVGTRTVSDKFKPTSGQTQYSVTAANLSFDVLPSTSDAAHQTSGPLVGCLSVRLPLWVSNKAACTCCLPKGCTRKVVYSLHLV